MSISKAQVIAEMTTKGAEMASILGGQIPYSAAVPDHGKILAILQNDVSFTDFANSGEVDRYIAACERRIKYGIDSLDPRDAATSSPTVTP